MMLKLHAKTLLRMTTTIPRPFHLLIRHCRRLLVFSTHRYAVVRTFALMYRRRLLQIYLQTSVVVVEETRKKEE